LLAGHISVVGVIFGPGDVIVVPLPEKRLAVGVQPNQEGTAAAGGPTFSSGDASRAAGRINPSAPPSASPSQSGHASGSTIRQSGGTQLARNRREPMDLRSPQSIQSPTF